MATAINRTARFCISHLNTIGSSTIRDNVKPVPAATTAANVIASNRETEVYVSNTCKSPKLINPLMVVTYSVYKSISRNMVWSRRNAPSFSATYTTMYEATQDDVAVARYGIPNLP